MQHSQALLLRTERFLPLFLTQALGAFNDNGLRYGITILIVYDLAAKLGINGGMFVALGAALFIAPYFLFSAIAGQLADKYDKALLARRILGSPIYERFFAAAPGLPELMVLGKIMILDEEKAGWSKRPKYDLIVVDALTPGMAYSGNLSSVEFFQLARRRLKPGGILCVWSPTPRVYRSFRAAFPHALEADNGSILLGSNDFILIDRASWRARALSKPTVSYFGGTAFAERILWALRTVRRFPAEIPPGTLNHDLFPRDEFRSR